MNRRTAFSVVAAAAAVTVAASSAQGQTVTLYPGLTYNSVTGTGYKSQSVATHPGITAGNGVGVGSASQYSNGSFVAGVAQRIDSSGNPIVLQPATAYSTQSTPYAVSAAGTSVGISNMYTSSGTSLGQAAVSWNASGGVTLLQNLGTNPNNGQSFGYAYALNAAGISTGQQYGYNNSSGSVVTSQYATRWDASGNINQLAALSTNSTTGSSSAVGYAINSSGTVVGNASLYSGTTNLGTRPTMWAGGGTAVIQMGVLGTSTTGTTSASAYAVNDSGISVGNVTAYNSSGTSLGSAPTRWDANGSVVDLNSLLSSTDASDFVLTTADSISNTDWVTAVATYTPAASTGEAAYSQEVLFNVSAEDPAAAPEPTSMILFASVTAVPILGRRRRRLV